MKRAPPFVVPAPAAVSAVCDQVDQVLSTRTGVGALRRRRCGAFVRLESLRSIGNFMAEVVSHADRFWQ